MSSVQPVHELLSLLSAASVFRLVGSDDWLVTVPNAKFVILKLLLALASMNFNLVSHCFSVPPLIYFFFSLFVCPSCSTPLLIQMSVSGRGIDRAKSDKLGKRPDHRQATCLGQSATQLTAHPVLQMAGQSVTGYMSQLWLICAGPHRLGSRC